MGSIWLWDYLILGKALPGTRAGSGFGTNFRLDSRGIFLRFFKVELTRKRYFVKFTSSIAGYDML